MRARSIALGVLLLFVSASAAWAQAGGAMSRLESTTPEQRAKLQTEFMQHKLSLTSEQLPKVSALNLQYAQEMEPALKGADRPLVRMREMQAIQQRKDAALQGVLSPAQFQTYLASKEEMREKLEQRLAEKAAGGGS